MITPKELEAKLDEARSLIKALMIDENNGVGNDVADCIWCDMCGEFDIHNNFIPGKHTDNCAWKRAKEWSADNVSQEQTCEWKYVDESKGYAIYETGCGSLGWERRRYCPDCGKRIVVKE